MAYQTEYGIYNHERPGKHSGLAVVAMHAKEDVIEGGLRYSYIRRFFSHQVNKHFGVGLDEFFNLPKYEADLLLDIANYESVQTEHTQRDLNKQLNLDLGK